MNLLLRNVLPENLPRVSLRCTDRGYTLTEADETLIAILFERFHVSSRNPDKQEFSRLILVLSETQTQLSLSDARKLDGFRLTLPPFPSILEMVSVNNLEGLTFDLYTDNTHLPTSKQHQLPPSDKWREFFQRHLTVTNLTWQSPKATLLTLALGRTEDLTPSTTILPDFPLPKLAALSLELCRLDEDEVAYFGAMLTSRARHGLAPKIDISECRGFNEGNIEDLSKTLTEEIAVRWDGVEDSDEEEEEEEEEHMGA